MEKQIETMWARIVPEMVRWGLSARYAGTIALASCVVSAAVTRASGGTWCPHWAAQVYAQKTGRTQAAVWMSIDRALRRAGLGMTVGQAMHRLVDMAIEGEATE